MSWGDIRNFHNKDTHPWIVLGDFNEILYSLEIMGGNARPNAMMEFRDCLIERGLDDLGFPGDPFTSRRGEIR